MSVRYFLVEMARGAAVSFRNKDAASWAPRHLKELAPASAKWESMGNARRWMLVRVTADDALLDTLDAKRGIVELKDNPDNARVGRIRGMLASRQLDADIEGVNGAEAALRIQAAIQSLVATETKQQRAALAAQMLAGH